MKSIFKFFIRNKRKQELILKLQQRITKRYGNPVEQVKGSSDFIIKIKFNERKEVRFYFYWMGLYFIFDKNGKLIYCRKKIPFDTLKRLICYGYYKSNCKKEIKSI